MILLNFSVIALQLSGSFLWMPKSVPAAAQCAFRLISNLRDYSLNANIQLSLKIIISCGSLELLYLGQDPHERAFLLRGTPVIEVASAVKHIRPGEIVISEQVYNEIKGMSETAPLAPGLFRLLSFWPQSGTSSDIAPVHAPSLVHAYQLSSMLPLAVLNRIENRDPRWSDETRIISSVFIRLRELEATSKDTIGNAWQAVSREVSRYEGTLKDIMIEDKGLVIFLVFGLPPLVHEDDPRRALCVATAIKSSLLGLGVQSDIGICSGYAFCGIVGNRQRRDYTVIGDTINVAVRLMSSESCQIVTDSATAISIGIDRFRELEPAQLKGKPGPVRRFCPTEDLSAGWSRRQGRQLLGREAELQDLEAALARGLRFLSISGEPGIGKSLSCRIRKAERGKVHDGP